MKIEKIRVKRGQIVSAVMLTQDNVFDVIDWMDTTKETTGILYNSFSGEVMGIVMKAYNPHDEPMTIFVGERVARVGDGLARINNRYFQNHCKVIE